MEGEETCRSCLKQEGNMHSLYELYDNQITLSALLKKFLNIEVFEKDGLPETFCSDCAFAVIEFYNFSVVFEESEKTLQTALRDCRDYVIKEERLHEDNTEHIILQELDTNQFIDSKEEIHVIYEDKACDVENSIMLETDSNATNEDSISLNQTSDDDTNITYKESNVIKEEILVLVDDDVELSKYECKEREEIFKFQKHSTNAVVDNDNNKAGNMISNELASKYCKKVLTKSVEVQSHAAKPFICEVCGRAFAKKAYLKEHSMSHSKVKHFECKYCGKRFRRRTVLAKHIKIHTCPKGIICEVCGQGFTDQSTLYTHQQLKHIRSRRFTCVICDMTFNLKSSLEKHIIRHQRQNTEKNFACDICNMKYYDKSSLKRHYDHKHSDEKRLFACDQCEKAYTSRTNLNKHILKHQNK